MSLSPVAAAVCLCLALGGAAVAAPSPKSKAPKEKGMAEAYKDLDLKKGVFTCAVPADWSQTRDERDDARTKTFGLSLSGPAGPEGSSPSISLRFYSPGNTVAKDAQAYLKRQLKPGLVKLKGEETSKASDTAVAGLPGRRFTRDTFEYLPPNSLETKEIPVREEYVVLPHRGGFFVLRFTAPRASFDRWRAVFQKVLDTFRPLD